MASLDAIFDESHRLTAASVRRLSGREVGSLRRMAAGEQTSRSRARALEAYTLARPAEAAPLLARIVEDEGEDVAFRAGAATLLARGPKRVAEPLLIAALAARPAPLVASKIAGALARIGGRDALDPLAAAAEGDGFAAQRARFAQLVIAHRTGVRGYEPTVPATRALLTVPRRGMPLRGGRVTAEELRILRATIGSDAYGVQLGNAATVAIQCGRNRFVAVVDGRVASGEAATRVLARPVLAGIVALRAEEAPAYSTRWVILAGPLAERQAYVALYDPSGRLALAGNAEVTASVARFQLRAVRAPGGFGVDVSGTVRGGSLSLSASTSAERTTLAAAPSPGRAF
jgi:hypothetical protein